MTKKNGKCSTAYQDVPYEDTVCNDEYVQECPQVWEERYGAKVWVPDTKNCVNLVSMKINTISEFPTLCPKVIKHLILQKCIPEKNQLPNCYKIQERRVSKMRRSAIP